MLTYEAESEPDLAKPAVNCNGSFALLESPTKRRVGHTNSLRRRPVERVRPSLRAASSVQAGPTRSFSWGRRRRALRA